jgi:hypothetical protein
LSKFCKIYERKEKAEKEKEVEEIKIEKRAPGNPSGPALESARGPTSKDPEPVPVFPLSLSDMRTPHVIINLQPFSHRSKARAVTPSPLFNPFIA